MRTLDEISKDYWNVYAEYDNYVDIIHPQKLESFSQRLHNLFIEFDKSKLQCGMNKASLHDTNPYRKRGE